MATTDNIAVQEHKVKEFPAPPSIDELQAQLKSLNVTDPLPVFPGSNPTSNPVDVFRCYIAEELAKISGVDIELVYPALEWTQSMDKGDLILAVPRLRIKGKKPDELAQEWADKWPENDFIEKPQVHKAFLSFFFKGSMVAPLVLNDILKRKENYGPVNTGKGKRIIVEFSSPNIAKPFHAGHLRSTIIGGFLSNVHEACGWDVIRMNYLGDWGKQFGILGVGFKRFGSEQKLIDDPIHHLYEIYVQINKVITEEAEIEKAKAEAEGKKFDKYNKQTYKGPTDDEARAFFKKMEDGDQEALGLWKRFRDLSIDKYKTTYARLNIFYDVYSGESQVSTESLNKAAQMMKDKGISQEDEGAVIIDFAKLGAKKLGKAVLQKKDGTSLYLTRDIGAAMERYEKYKFDKMIYVVASQQDLHLNQLFKILELLGLDWYKKCQHINFGMVQGMSTRKGTVVFLDDILAGARDSMHEIMKKNADKYGQVEDPDFVADTVGRTGVMIQDMAGKRINNYVFSWDRMLSFEGDTGPYLQYAHARLSSIGRKVREAYPEGLDVTKADLTLLKEPHAVNLIRCLAQYPDVLQNTLKTLEPTTVVTYLFKMTHLLSSSYDVLRVLGENKELMLARLALYAAAKQVLGNGMKVLGLVPVERM
ncbi:arginyl-tRNA synthetase [Ascodesmis nigricans]|uniref:arginine--tRNA ligase n=1 Tax=Ascodesmis nigricans TaxID=341454 RepID=A0A4S2N4X8_9PEZI|nr:arginyl-tRNA synthetase [Ascodesmis nigricans]